MEHEAQSNMKSKNAEKKDAVAAAIVEERLRLSRELHDRATYRYFWNLLQKARVTGVALPEEAAEAFF